MAKIEKTEIDLTTLTLGTRKMLDIDYLGVMTTFPFFVCKGAHRELGLIFVIGSPHFCLTCKYSQYARHASGVAKVS
jgi:hypothetical protein